MALIQTQYGIASSKVADQKFSYLSKTKKYFNTARGEWTGANTLRIYTMTTAPLVAYDEGSTTPLSGAGGIVLAQNTYVDYSVSRTLGQSLLINDLLTLQNPAETVAARTAAMLKEQVAPAYDQYNYAQLVLKATNAPLLWTPGNATTNAKNIVQSAVSVLQNARVTMSNVIGFATQDFINDAMNSLTSNSALGYQSIANGALPNIMGIPFEVVAQQDLPGSTRAIVVSKDSVLAPIIVDKVRTNTTPTAFGGTELLFRQVNDLFVLSEKANGIVVINAAP